MHDDDDDFNFEPVRGLPAHLPQGEEMLWQGRPVFVPLAWRAGFIRLLTIWFAIVAAWFIARGALGITAWPTTAGALFAWTVNAAIAAGILSIIALGIQRTTVYTITTRRLVMRFGMVLDLTVNIPYSKIDNMDLRMTGGDTGDIAIRLIGNDDLSYFHLWPHARPWLFSAPEAMMRAVPEAEKVGRLLGDAVRAEQARLDGRPAVRMPNPFDKPAPAVPLPAGGAIHPAE